MTVIPGVSSIFSDSSSSDVTEKMNVKTMQDKHVIWFDDSRAKIMAFNAYIRVEGDISKIEEEFKRQTDAIQQGLSLLEEECKKLTPLESGLYLNRAEENTKQITKKLDRSKKRIEWMKKLLSKLAVLGLPKEVITEDPDLTSFLIDTKLVYTINAFVNTTPLGKMNHTLRVIEGKVHLKVEGQWLPWKEVKAKICYNKETACFVGTEEAAQEWIYISPDGFVKQSRFDYKEIYPIEQLSPDEHDKLVRHSLRYYESNVNPSPSVEKRAVLQVFTTDRDYGIPQNWITDNLLKEMPRHVSLRLINSKGQVYSFGFEMKKSEGSQIEYSLFNYFKTGNVQIPAIDYEETRQFTKRQVTSLPLDDEAAKKVLDFVNEHNKTGVRFNFIKQNCAKFAAETMRVAGYPLDIAQGFDETVIKIMPRISEIPYVGKSIANVAKVIFSVIGYVASIVKNWTPSCIKIPISYLSEGLVRSAALVGTVVRNLLILVFGGAKMTPFAHSEDEFDNRNKLTRFSRLIRQPFDMLSDEISTINHSAKIVEWQNSLNTTVNYEYESCKLYGLVV